MLFCCMPPSFEPVSNAYLQKLMNILKALSLAQLILGVLQIVTCSTGFGMILGAMIIFYIIRFKNWLYGLLYIFFSLLDIWRGIMYFGEKLYSGSVQIIQIVEILKIPLLVIGVYYIFLTYKELKALSIENAARVPNLEMRPIPRNVPPPRRFFDRIGHGHV